MAEQLPTIVFRICKAKDPWAFVSVSGLMAIALALSIGAITLGSPHWEMVVPATVFVEFLGLAIIWASLKLQTESITVTEEGLLFRTSIFDRRLPFGSIAEVSAHSASCWQRDNLRNFLARCYVRYFGEAPNLKITFRDPVSLGSMPWPWCKSCELTIENPQDFAQLVRTRISRRSE